jgi:hypothetical protein
MNRATDQQFQVPCGTLSGMSAAGAPYQRSRQKPRREIALGNFAIDNRQAEPAAHGVMSDEIAAGDFIQ